MLADDVMSSIHPVSIFSNVINFDVLRGSYDGGALEMHVSKKLSE